MEKNLVEGLEDFLRQDVQISRCTCPGRCPIHGGGLQPEYGVPPILQEK